MNTNTPAHGVPPSHERQPLDVDLPERVIDQLVAEAKFSYLEPTEEEVYALANAIKREVLARIPNAWLTPNAGVDSVAGRKHG